MPINFNHQGNIISTGDGVLDFNMTGAIKVPLGTTAQQPANVTGYIRFNSTTNFFEGYDGTSWVIIGSDQPLRTTDSVTFDNIAITSAITTVDSIMFDTAAGITPAEGRISWNDASGTLNVGLKGGNVTIQVGQEVVVRVYNGTGLTLNNGEVVRITGSFGGTITAELADASASSTSNSTIGIVTESILNANEGYVTLLGLVRDLNTSAFAAGDEVWLSTVAGQITNIKPASPDHPVRVGWVAVSNATTGEIFASVSVAGNAADISYDNTTSGLVATNVQAGIDELQLSKASVSQLSSNIILYGTTTVDVGSGYQLSVTETSAPEYNNPAVDVSTVAIVSEITPTLISSFIGPAGFIVGNTGAITVTTVGNLRQTAGSPRSAKFYGEYYHRTSGGTETLIGTTNQTTNITNVAYQEHSASALIADTTFSATDHFVTKLYAIKDAAGGNNPIYEIQFGGTNPARTLVPVQVSVIPSDVASDIIVDTSNFTSVLSGADSTVQLALDTIDDHTHAALYEPKNLNIQAHIIDTTNPHSVTKAQVGLGNVDNTSDANKPISTLTQTALDLKLNISSYTAGDILSKLLTVDGSGSLLDADLLDGLDSTYFQRGIFVQTATPTGAVDGDMWFYTEDASLFVYYDDINSSAWIGISGPSGGGAGSGSVFVDTGTYVYYGGPRNVGIGVATPAFALDVVGDINASGDVIAYSDKRLKTDINTVENAINIVKQLRGVTFRKHNETRMNVGVIAQEVQTVLPEAVHVNPDTGYLSVAYGNMVGVLIEAIKEQQTIIDNQETRLAALEAFVAKMTGI